MGSVDEYLGNYAFFFHLKLINQLKETYINAVSCPCYLLFWMTRQSQQGISLIQCHCNLNKPTCKTCKYGKSFSNTHTVAKNPCSK